MKFMPIPPEGLVLGSFPPGADFGPPIYKFGPWPVKPDGEDDRFYSGCHIRLCTMPDGTTASQHWVMGYGWSIPKPVAPPSTVEAKP